MESLPLLHWRAGHTTTLEIEFERQRAKLAGEQNSGCGWLAIELVL